MKVYQNQLEEQVMVYFNIILKQLIQSYFTFSSAATVTSTMASATESSKLGSFIFVFPLTGPLQG